MIIIDDRLTSPLPKHPSATNAFRRMSAPAGGTSNYKQPRRTARRNSMIMASSNLNYWHSDSTPSTFDGSWADSTSTISSCATSAPPTDDITPYRTVGNDIFSFPRPMDGAVKSHLDARRRRSNPRTSNVQRPKSIAEEILSQYANKRPSACFSILDVKEDSKALYKACRNDAPVKEIEALLYKNPYCIEATLGDPPKTPLEIVEEMSRVCICGYCNYNQRKILDCLKKGCEYYQTPPVFSWGPSECDDASVTSVDACTNDDRQSTTPSWHESASSVCYGENSRRSSIFSRSSLFGAEYPAPEPSEPSLLTASALSDVAQAGYNLMKDRKGRWLKYKKLFIDLQNEKNDLEWEEQSTKRELDEKNNILKELRVKISQSEVNNSKGLFAKMMHNDVGSIEKIEYKIGITNLDIEDLSRYVIELNTRKEKLNRRSKRLYMKVFGRIDEEIITTLGADALECGKKIHSEINIV